MALTGQTVAHPWHTPQSSPSTIANSFEVLERRRDDFDAGIVLRLRYHIREEHCKKDF